MTKHLASLCFALIAAWLAIPVAAQSLEAGFETPPREAGVRCWWWWLNSNVTKQAVTRDLEAMHDKGFSGAMIFDAGTELRWGPDENPPNGPQFAGPEWTELYLHALHEANRFDLKLGLSIQSGWNLGGPTVTLDDKAKQITWSEVEVGGGERVDLALPPPKANYDYYRDICVLAWPSKQRGAANRFVIRASSEQSRFPIANITNGVDYWVSGGRKPGDGPSAESPEWIEVEFQHEVVLSGVRINGRLAYGPRRCRVQSADGKQSTEVFRVKDAGHTQSFAPMSGKAFRLVFEDAYDPKHPGEPRNVQVEGLELFDEHGDALLGVTRRPIRDLTAKSGAKELGGSAPDCRFLLDDVPAVEGEEDARLEDIVDLTRHLDASGVLHWDAPAGPWTVIRIGYTPTQAHVATSSDNWQGHVLDYLSADVFNRYWDEHIEPLMIAAGPMAGTVLTHLETDSWECGGMNWSPGFAEDFKAYNGYDIVKWLPVAAGKIVDNRAASNAFLADFRKTIAHCVSENHYRTFAERAAKHGIGIQPECSGPHAAPIDGITNYKHSDIVMSEFWIPCPHRPTPPKRFFVKQAASSAHIYGKRIVAAESFTSLKKPHWGVEVWRDMKPHVDYEFCEGLNMVFFHTFTCSPKEMGIPGQEYFAGTHINPQITWWDQAGAFIDYLNRIQFVAQQGRFAGDVLYYYGDHVPNIAVNKGFNQAGSLPGYDYDVTNEEVLLLLETRDGKVVVPSGLEYRLLALPDHKVLSLAALEKVGELLHEGAVVVGPKPERLVSLVGGDAAQARFHKLAASLWGADPGEKGARRIGKGRLVWGQSARECLQSAGVAYDFEVLDVERQSDFEFIHYTLNGGDLYFVSNQTDQPQSVNVAFRVSGKQPELWAPVTGVIAKASAFTQADGRTTVPVRFEPFGSCLVFFRETIPVSQQGAADSNHPVLATVATVDGPWNVAFDEAWGGPASIVFNELVDWTQHEDEGVVFYSGAAVYTTSFELTPESGVRYWLQLNDVRDVGMATVTLNGKDLDAVWTVPFRLEATEALKDGENELAVTVVNSWQNRLIGDRGKPQQDRYTKTNITIRDDWQLRPSGLLGPVEIKASRPTAAP